MAIISRFVTLVLSSLVVLLKAADRVVPAAQATTFHVLLTPLITYAEVDQASTLTAVWRLIHFWAQLLNE